MSMDKTRYLRQRANWFMDMAGQAASGGLFEKFIALAAAYHERALAAEHAHLRVPAPVVALADYSRARRRT